MSTAYIYNLKSMRAVTVLNGASSDIDRYLDAHDFDTDFFGVTYSPAFGFANGLAGINATARYIDVPEDYDPTTDKTAGRALAIRR